MRRTQTESDIRSSERKANTRYAESRYILSRLSIKGISVFTRWVSDYSRYSSTPPNARFCSGSLT